MPGSPADLAGLEENDIILKIDGEKIDNEEPFARLIAKYSVGDEVELTVLHKGAEKTIKAILTERQVE
jgi:S1-C subfamily serine protease